MVLHAKCHVEDGAPTYSISDGAGHKIEGVTPADYRQFVGDMENGLYNPGVLFLQARARAERESTQLRLLP